MKRYNHIIILAVITLILLGCEKDNNAGLVDGAGKVISYTSSVEDTKATISNIDTLQKYGSFNVAAFKTVDGNGYYYADEVKYNSTTLEWASDATRYWPAIGNLNFFAYYPYKDFITITAAEDYEEYSLNYVCPVEIDNQVDLLAETLKNQSYSQIALEFKHILSGIKFKVEFEGETNITLASININYVNIEREGNYNFYNEDWDAPLSKYFNSTDGCVTYIVPDEEKTSSSGSVIFDDIDNQLLIIPQQISSSDSDPHYISIQIEYALNSGQDQSSVDVITGVMQLPAPNSDNKYKKGEIYTYSVVVNDTQLSIGGVSVEEQNEPVAAYGNIDLGLITKAITLSEYNTAVADAQASKVADASAHLYYSTALRVFELLDDGVRDFVVIGDYVAGGDDDTNDGKLGYSGSESSPFFIAAQSLGMMPSYSEYTDEYGNETKEFTKTLNDDGTYTIEGLNRDYLFSIDLRGVYDFPEFTHSTTTTDNLLEDGDEMLPSYAFRDIALLDEVVFPIGLKAIGNYAFENCVSLESVDIAGVVHIEPGGFSDCINLKSVIGDDGALTRIHANAFDDCENLTTIDLKNVVEVDEYGFINCFSLNDVDLSSLDVIGEHAFQGCAELTLKSETTIPDFTEVARYAFKGCVKLGQNGSKINLHTTTSVGDHAFADCQYIQSSSNELDLLESVGEYAFSGCSTLGLGGEVSMSKLSTIGNASFNGCSGLNIVSGLSNLTIIPNYAFQNCTSLIGYLSSASEQTLSLPLVESVGNLAFSRCSSLTNISFGTEEKLKTIGDNALNNCTSLTAVTGLEGVTSVGVYAFAGSNLISELNFSDNNLTSIADYAFAGCLSLTTISGLGGVASVGIEAFSGMSLLTSLNLSSATSVGAKFISGCRNLKSFSMPLVVNDSFYDENNDVDDTKDKISTMLKSASATLETINVEALQIESFPSWTSWSENNVLQSVNIAACLKLEDAAFANSKALTSVVASSAVEVGANAFDGCDELNYVDISSATSVGGSAFSSCYKLQTLKMSSLEAALSSWCFSSNYTNLEYVDISSVVGVENGTFNGCTALKTVYAKSATFIGLQAFKDCTSLEELDLSGVTETPSNEYEDYNYPFYGASTQSCTLYLNQEQIDDNVTNGNTWYNATWKEIIVK